MVYTAEHVPIVSENSRVLSSRPFRWVLAHINKFDIRLWNVLACWIFWLHFIHQWCGVFSDEVIFIWDELFLTSGPRFTGWSVHRPPFWQSIALEFVDVPVFTSVKRYYEFTSTLAGEWVETAIYDALYYNLCERQDFGRRAMSEIIGEKGWVYIAL